MKRLLRALILILVRIYGGFGAKKASRRRRLQSAERSPRILLVRPDHLGDLIMTTPILQAIKEQLPDAQLTMMIGPWSSEVVAHHPAVDRLLTCPFPGFQRATQKALEPYKLLLRTARQLKQSNYDLAINLRPDFWWGAALLYLAAIPERIGYATELTTPFLSQALPFPAAEHATISNLRLGSVALQALGAPALIEPYTPARYPLYFKPHDDELAWADARLQEAGMSTGKPIVVIHVGTGGAVKLWRNDGWTHIAQLLVNDTLLPSPAHVIFTGSKSERPMIEEITAPLQGSALILTETTVGQLAALIVRADLVLGVDNGPLHMAAAQDTPSLRLFGPTDAHIFGPWGAPERHQVLASTHRCPGCPSIPCGRLDFTAEELPEHPCVRLITDQQVEQAIKMLVGTAAEQAQP
ncbi:glycosyltransferase family 9 protein [Dictyobacter formicarum]|uniref:Glycosyl transferase n=1 Tax=Dictyobacter formicarum TaxID=2778368 RepID=A0ABQ3VAN7_9CHLR|nr:glycosyltransferase family 9 protein [Dictyobacter formicarum]GHO83084.1 glycosyl transferase [Dictyobacter formicarum]